MDGEGINSIGSENSVLRSEAARSDLARSESARTEEANTASASERAEVSRAANESSRDEVRAQEDAVTSRAREADKFEPATQPASPSGFSTGAAADRAELDRLSDQMAASSPRANGLISDFKSRGGTFEPSNRGGYFDEKQMVIGVPRGSDAERMRGMSHELGHYEYSKSRDGAYVPPAAMSGGNSDHQAEQRREHNYVVQNTERRLADEAHATLTNNQIRNEMRASSGVDIGVSGDSPDRPIPFLPNASVAEQRRAIGEFYGANLSTSTTGENYREFYNKTYIDHYRDNFMPGRER